MIICSWNHLFKSSTNGKSTNSVPRGTETFLWVCVLLFYALFFFHNMYYLKMRSVGWIVPEAELCAYPTYSDNFQPPYFLS